jgi:hypothetical protein
MPLSAAYKTFIQKQHVNILSLSRVAGLTHVGVMCLVGKCSPVGGDDDDDADADADDHDDHLGHDHNGGLLIHRTSST